MSNKSIVSAVVILVSASRFRFPRSPSPWSRDSPNHAPIHVGENRHSSQAITAILIDGNHLTIQKGKNVVAEAEGRWEDRDTEIRL